MSAGVAEGTARRNGSRSQPTSADGSSAGEVHEGRGAVVVVGLLQLAPGAALRGLAFNKIDQSLKAATLPEKAKTTVDLWLDSPGGSARDAYKIALLLRSIAGHIRVVIPDYAKSAATLLSLVADERLLGLDEILILILVLYVSTIIYPHSAEPFHTYGLGNFPPCPHSFDPLIIG